MKSAGEYVDEIHGSGDLPDDVRAIIIRTYKSYAKQVAERALSEAAENAIYISVGRNVSIVKSSITNTKIQLP